MISVLLTILKVLGILILALVGILLAVLLLVLFVPVRYMARADRTAEGEGALSLKLKVTWLLHLVSARFLYPEEAYIRVRVLGITVFRSDKPAPTKKKKKPEKDKKPKKKAAAEEKTAAREKAVSEEKTAAKEEAVSEERTAAEEKAASEEETAQSFFQKIASFFQKLARFCKKLVSILRNLRYTILQICDKIKEIVKNIKYYIAVISSDEFKRTFQLCSGQAGVLLRHIRPRKIRGNLLIGTGDPASTGQVFAIYGMLYPFLGSRIVVTPDFERQIVEGDLFLKGRITLFKLVKCAWIVYFNKDLRRVIKMLKREAE